MTAGWLGQAAEEGEEEKEEEPEERKESEGSKELEKEKEQRGGRSSGERRDQSREARRLRERQAASSAAATNEIPKLARLDYRDLQTATNNFSPDGVINRDQHGNETFLGSFQGRQVVIKRMQLNSNEGADLLIARLEPYSQLQHQNILPVVGVCIHKDALDVVLHVVRPHARNGSTGDRLHHQNGMPPLLFGTRLHIAIGAAKALAYMHEKEMVHRNFNSSVVSGMALRSKAPSAQSGYLDPVFDETGEVDAMSDIYSYGVFLLELLTGQLAYDSARSPPSLVGRMRPLLKSGKALDLMDASVVWPPETATALADVAAGCIKRDPEDRTPLQQVIVVLEQQAEQHGLYQAYYYYPPQDDSAPSAPPAEELPTPTASTPYPPAQQEPTSRTPYPNTKPYTQPTPSYTPYPDLGSNMSHIVEPKPSYTPYPDLGPNAGSSTGPKSTFPNPNPALQQASKPATGKFPYPSGIASSKYEPRCALCMVGNIDARLLPCTHAVTCTPCAAYLKAQSPVCPVCRARVTGWSDINSATGNDDDEECWRKLRGNVCKSSRCKRSARDLKKNNSNNMNINKPPQLHIHTELNKNNNTLQHEQSMYPQEDEDTQGGGRMERSPFSGTSVGHAAAVPILNPCFAIYIPATGSLARSSAANGVAAVRLMLRICCAGHVVVYDECTFTGGHLSDPLRVLCYYR
eukprot:jgi/Chlat1/2363/Chrsp17S02809